jgi:hypothetical protein
MAEKVVDTKVESEEEVDPTVETPVEKKEEKLFNQKEVDNLIQTRVKREKDSVTTLQKNWEAEKTSYEDKINKYDESLNKILEVQKENLNLDPSLKELLEKLSVFDQLEYLAKLKPKTKDIPSTPAFQDKTNDSQSKKKLNNFL